ncbi:hypothetical protein O3M35_010922 [Rhynocoris fuscipes]|uniref:Methyltransferase domain-containing protein n=1 Tax=Rhynocoris fuscipes TaxID=488301 RepID=A0AAW1D1R0_9HEMI
MKIPNNLLEMDVYFDKVIKLLEEWQWIYEDRATDILLSDTLNSHFLDFLERLDYNELNQLPNGFIKEEWPEKLKNFIKDCNELSLIYETYPYDETSQIKIPTKVKSKKYLSAKKEHEIYRLADYVVKYCNDNNITRVYDIGSGLGYIDRLLISCSDLSIVGIESDKSKIETAIKLDNSLLEKDKLGNITYLGVRLETFTIEKVFRHIKQYEDNGCIIGLHACADLTVDTLKLFLLLEKVKSLVLMPCCYHKVQDNESAIISSLLISKLYPNKMKLINSTFLRLACESTKERWLTQTEHAHNYHGFSVLARAVVQSYMNYKNYKAKRSKNNCITAQHNMQWPQYIKIWLKRNDILNELNEVVNSDTLETELLEYWPKYKHLIKRIECFTSLQVCLQSLAESLLMADKLCYLLQYALKNVNAIRITDPAISPRSLAIVASK